MDNVASFEVARFQRFAREFVDRYEEHGPEFAGVYAVGELTQDEIIQVQPYVHDELLARGYTFPNEDMEDME